METLANQHRTFSNFPKDHHEQKEPTTPHVREEILSSPSFLVRLRIAMCTTSQDQVDAINAHLYLLSDPVEIEDLVNEHTAELKEKASKSTIKLHIISQMNELIERINKMAIA